MSKKLDRVDNFILKLIWEDQQMEYIGIVVLVALYADPGLMFLPLLLIQSYRRRRKQQ